MEIFESKMCIFSENVVISNVDILVITCHGFVRGIFGTYCIKLKWCIFMLFQRISLKPRDWIILKSHVIG